MSNTRSGGQHENNMKIENIPLNKTKKTKKKLAKQTNRTMVSGG